MRTLRRVRQSLPSSAIGGRSLRHSRGALHHYSNEKEYPFPDWLDSGMHNAIIAA
jgi:hypothetical protein